MIDLRRLRLRLTLQYGVLSLLAVGLLAILAIRASGAERHSAAEKEAERFLSDLTLTGKAFTENPDARNTWLVNPQDRSSRPLGETWIEPPLQRVAQDALDGPVSVDYREDGHFLLQARKVGENQALVTALDLESYDRAASSTRVRVILAALGASAVATLAASWLAGRSLEPARLAMQQQREFITDAAHELRTPLSVITAAAGHALARDREASDYREALAEVHTASERARLGVDELLELARLQAGQVAPRRGPLRVDLLLEEVVAGVRVDGCDVLAEMGDPTVIDADYALLRQAIETVTRNAAARATKVVLRTEADGNDLAVVIADDGPGFPVGLGGTAPFERFRRGDAKGSHGLGMAIAARIVELHNGRCRADNLTGGGAEVRLVLPRG